MSSHFKKHSKKQNKRFNRHSPENLVRKLLLKIHGVGLKPVLISVGGPGGIGKSTFAFKLSQVLDDSSVLTLDDYKTSRLERKKKNIYGAHPDANEMELIASHLNLLKKNKSIEKPLYCSKKGVIHKTVIFNPSRFIIVEGEVSTYEKFRDIIDFSIFLDSHWKTQLQTRIRRDIEQRGYTPEKAIATFLHSNLREFASYGATSKQWSDVHIHCDENYNLKIDGVCETLLEHFS